MAEYKAGICNIGLRGRVSRAGYAAFSFAISFILLRTIQVNHFPEYSKLLLLIPLFFAFLSLCEALSGFCVKHARKGTYYMEQAMKGKSGEERKVGDKEHMLDMQKAKAIAMISALSALALTLVSFLV